MVIWKAATKTGSQSSQKSAISMSFWICNGQKIYYNRSCVAKPKIYGPKFDTNNTRQWI